MLLTSSNTFDINFLCRFSRFRRNSSPLLPIPRRTPGYLKVFCMGMLCPKIQTLTRFIGTTFDQKGTPFIYLYKTTTSLFYPDTCNEKRLMTVFLSLYALTREIPTLSIRLLPEKGTLSDGTLPHIVHHRKYPPAPEFSSRERGGSSRKTRLNSGLRGARL